MVAGCAIGLERYRRDMETPPATPYRMAYLIGGYAAVGLGVIGIFLPVMPTVPFLILAAFCFGKSDPKWERKLLDHPRFGPSIRAWRAKGAIPVGAKLASIGMLTGSGVGGLLLIDAPWGYLPASIAVLTGGWIAARPNG